MKNYSQIVFLTIFHPLLSSIYLHILSFASKMSSQPVRLKSFKKSSSKISVASNRRKEGRPFHTWNKRIDPSHRSLTGARAKGGFHTEVEPTVFIHTRRIADHWCSPWDRRMTTSLEFPRRGIQIASGHGPGMFLALSRLT